MKTTGLAKSFSRFADGNWNFEGDDYSVRVDGKTGCVSELHCRNDPAGISCVDRTRRFAAMAYTLRTDDITKEEKPEFSPYRDREAVYPDGCESGDGLSFFNSELHAVLTYRFAPDAVVLDLVCENEEVSECGLNLPLAFLGKQGSNYKYQFLPSTPYVSSDGNLRYWIFSRPDASPLLIACRTHADGWKLDYSEAACGHYVENVKFLESFDRAYGRTPRKEHHITLEMKFAASFEETREKLCRSFGLPMACLLASGGRTGQKLAVRILGVCDRVCVRAQEGTEETTCTVERSQTGETVALVPLSNYGIQIVTPFRDGKRGFDCRVFAYDSLDALFRRNCLAIHAPFHCDDNLCEGGVWAEALCRNMRLMGRDEKLEGLVRWQLGRVMPGTGGTRIPRCSIPADSSDGFPAYHVFRSSRVQEQFFGVSFLMQTYLLSRNKKYLEYAVNTMMCLLNCCVSEEGEVVRREPGAPSLAIDYTTVTAPAIVVADMARLLKAEGDPRFAVMEDAAVRIADYLVRRGVDFPTEGEIARGKQKEMEDGSISCTALSVLYVCYYISYKAEYVAFAEKILRVHDAWVMHTPDARLNHSSLRWWETLWEGDADGPAICGGHAWTIWRAEADFYDALLTCNAERLLDSCNGFFTNLSKIQKDGTSYSCYSPDPITGGGFAKSGTDVSFRLNEGFPRKADQSLSKYLWTRMEDTWRKTAAVLTFHGAEIVLNAELRMGADGRRVLRLASPDIRRVFLDAKPGKIMIQTDFTLQLLTKRKLKIDPDCNPVSMGFCRYGTPQNGELRFSLGEDEELRR